MRVRAIISDHPVATAIALLGGLAVAVLVLVWFQPQKLLIDARLDEELPLDATEAAEAPAEPPRALEADASDPHPQGAPPPMGPTLVARGAFRSLEHATRGGASLVRLAGEAHVVRLEDLDTSNGPDLRVYLSTAPAHARASDFDNDFVDLGPLKANQGNHNYPVPAAVDLARYRSVVIWCRRFSVGFAVAPLA